MRITYIGHATLLIEVAGQRLLTDPNFDPALGRFLARVSQPGMALEALPALDALLLTHAHADHLSFDSLGRLPTTVPLFAPPVVAKWLRAKGYRQAEPLAPGAEVRLGGVVVHAAGATHVGARYGFDRWRGAANMYMIDAGDAGTCFFAGDTGLMPATHDFAAKHCEVRGRPLDVALLPIGHPPPWKMESFRRGHLTSDDALTLFERLGARYMIPYHWGTFNHVTSTAFDAIDRLRVLVGAHARGADVRIIEPGESFEFSPGSAPALVPSALRG